MPVNERFVFLFDEQLERSRELAAAAAGAGKVFGLFGKWFNHGGKLIEGVSNLPARAGEIISRFCRVEAETPCPISGIEQIMVKKTAQHLELLPDCLDWFQTELLGVAAAFLQDILGELRYCDSC